MYKKGFIIIISICLMLCTVCSAFAVPGQDTIKLIDNSENIGLKDEKIRLYSTDNIEAESGIIEFVEGKAMYVANSTESTAIISCTTTNQIYYMQGNENNDYYVIVTLVHDGGEIKKYTRLSNINADTLESFESNSDLAKNVELPKYLITVSVESDTHYIVIEKGKNFDVSAEIYISEAAFMSEYPSIDNSETTSNLSADDDNNQSETKGSESETAAPQQLNNDTTSELVILIVVISFLNIVLLVVGFIILFSRISSLKLDLQYIGKPADQKSNKPGGQKSVGGNSELKELKALRELIVKKILARLIIIEKLLKGKSTTNTEPKNVKRTTPAPSYIDQPSVPIRDVKADEAQKKAEADAKREQDLVEEEKDILGIANSSDVIDHEQYSSTFFDKYEHLNAEQKKIGDKTILYVGSNSTNYLLIQSKVDENLHYVLSTDESCGITDDKILYSKNTSERVKLTKLPKAREEDEGKYVLVEQGAWE